LVQGTKPSLDERDLAAYCCFSVDAESVPYEELRNVFLSSKGRLSDPSVEQMGNIEVIENDNEQVVDDDNVEDPFATLRLEPNGDVATKLFLGVDPATGSYDLNLSRDEMELFAAIPKSSSASDSNQQQQVEAVLRRVLAKRLEEYKQRGLEGILPYRRPKNKTYEPGQELAKKSELMPLLEKISPEFYKYLNEYPNSKPSAKKVEESFSWVNFIADDKPNLCLVHKIGMPVETKKQGDGDGGSDNQRYYLFCQRHFYVMRGHNSVQGVGGAFPVVSSAADDDDSKRRRQQHLLLYVSRTSTDQVSGFGGAAKRAIGARIMGGKIADNMDRLRTSLQTK